MIRLLVQAYCSSLRWRLITPIVLILIATTFGAVALQRYATLDSLHAALIATAIGFILVAWCIANVLQPVFQLFNALNGTVSSYKDADFSTSLHWKHADELKQLVVSHNQLGDVLRKQRLDLVQRELLLDTMVQHTPVAMLLVSDGGQIVYANLAARQLLNNNRKLEGHALSHLLDRANPALRNAMTMLGDGIFTLEAKRDATDATKDDDDDTYHLARRVFTLNGRKHELLLLRHLTATLRRTEVQTWKKVIRVISHELNNSLAPVASLAHSGSELLARGKTDRIDEILRTIADRTKHLEAFIQGYAQFAKLPTPRIESINWPSFVQHLHASAPFQLNMQEPIMTVYIDAAQMEQALINVIKNAHESGSPPNDVVMTATIKHAINPDTINPNTSTMSKHLCIEITDRGPGMSETVLTNALTPFYSTKRTGTGLGLGLAREIVEAHGGYISLHNRNDLDGAQWNGLSVVLTIPIPIHLQN